MKLKFKSQTEIKYGDSGKRVRHSNTMISFDKILKKTW